jgi:hypothetical protein
MMHKALRDIDGITGPSSELSNDIMRVVKLVWGEAGLLAVSRACATKDEDEEEIPVAANDYEVAEPGIATMSLNRRRLGLLEEPSITALGELVRTGRATQAESQRMCQASESERRNFIECRTPLPAGCMPH